MDKTIQDRARETMIKKLEDAAFESLALYSYWGARYEPVNKQIEEMQDRIKTCEDEIKAIQDKPSKTKEDRDKQKALQNDVDAYDKRIEGVGTLAKKLLEKTTGYREQGVTYLEQIEHAKNFTLKTPEEIAKDKIEAQTK